MGITRGNVVRTFILIALAAVVVASMTGCGTTIPAGEVGIKVNQWGTNRGVQDYPLATGRIMFNPITEDVFKFPTYKQNRVWTKDTHEGSAHDESITFNSLEGAVINADIFISYSFEAAKVPSIYVEFRQTAETITDVYIRSEVRDAFSRAASTMKVTDIFGRGKADLERTVLADLQRRLGPRGFKIDAVSFVGALRVDKDVANAIHAVIVATQRAIEAQNKIVQSQAEAQQNIASARGDSLADVIRAMGKARANEELTRSLNPSVLEWARLNKWNGVLPTVTGGATPFINVNK